MITIAIVTLILVNFWIIGSLLYLYKKTLKDYEIKMKNKDYMCPNCKAWMGIEGSKSILSKVCVHCGKKVEPNDTDSWEKRFAREFDILWFQKEVALIDRLKKFILNELNEAKNK